MRCWRPAFGIRFTTCWCRKTSTTSPAAPRVRAPLRQVGLSPVCTEDLSAIMHWPMPWRCGQRGEPLVVGDVAPCTLSLLRNRSVLARGWRRNWGRQRRRLFSFSHDGSGKPFVLQRSVNHMVAELAIRHVLAIKPTYARLVNRGLLTGRYPVVRPARIELAPKPSEGPMISTSPRSPGARILTSAAAPAVTSVNPCSQPQVLTDIICRFCVR